jgi:hypothetical protein
MKLAESYVTRLVSKASMLQITHSFHFYFRGDEILDEIASSHKAEVARQRIFQALALGMLAKKCIKRVDRCSGHH